MKLANYNLEVTTVGSCSISCGFCPQNSLHRAYHGPPLLNLQNFMKAISNVPDGIGINFSGFSEPFLNPDCMEMIEYANQKGHPLNLFSTLVGLKSEDVLRLAKIDFLNFCLHLPDNLGNAHIPITDDYRKTLSEVLTTMRVDDWSCMNQNFMDNERAGLTRDARQFHRKGWFNCAKFDGAAFVMLPSCDVVLCCMDFGLKHILGNLLEESFMELVNGSVYRAIRRNRWQINGDILCRSCTRSNFTRYLIDRTYSKFERYIFAHRRWQ